MTRSSSRATRPTLAELDRNCQKLGHRHLGNWMARRIARPVALRVSWLIAPWGISANAATLGAWACGIAAAAAFGWGSPVGWIAGAMLLQLWYLLDHVDGQLARLHRTESLDGVAIDYLMHHSLSLLIPCGVGWGMAVATFNPVWLIVGFAWGSATLLAALVNDVRYKAFFQRLKRVDGRMLAVGGGGGRPAPARPVPRHALPFLSWLAHKAIEAHVVMNTLALLSFCAWYRGRVDLLVSKAYTAGMLLSAVLVAGWAVARVVRRDDAEQEFAAWFRTMPGTNLVYRHGWWVVEVVPIAPEEVTMKEYLPAEAIRECQPAASRNASQ